MRNRSIAGSGGIVRPLRMLSPATAGKQVMEVLGSGEIMMTSFVSRRVLCALMLVLGAGASSMSAQTFTNIPGLSFTAQVNGANPLPQVMTVTSTGAQMAFNLTPSTTTGGSWLSTVPTGTECCSTPEGAIVSVNIS